MSGSGANIKRLREAHGMTQADIAKIAGVTDKAVSTWESGQKEPRMGAIDLIAAYFNVKPSQIVDDEDILETKTAPITEDERKTLERINNLPEKERKMLLAFLDTLEDMA